MAQTDNPVPGRHGQGLHRRRRHGPERAGRDRHLHAASGWSGWWPTWTSSRARSSRRSRRWPPRPAPRMRPWPPGSRRWKRGQASSESNSGISSPWREFCHVNSPAIAKAVESFPPAGDEEFPDSCVTTKSCASLGLQLLRFVAGSAMELLRMTFIHQDDEPLDALHPSTCWSGRWRTMAGPLSAPAATS